MLSKEDLTSINHSNYCDRCGSPIGLGRESTLEYDGETVLKLCSKCQEILKNQRTNPNSDVWIFKRELDRREIDG